MDYKDEQKAVATGVTDGTSGKQYSKVFPYEEVGGEYQQSLSQLIENTVLYGSGFMRVAMEGGKVVSNVVDPKDYRYIDEAFDVEYAIHKRNEVLEEVAAEFDKMPALGDTAASFAAFVRRMKR